MTKLEYNQAYKQLNPQGTNIKWLHEKGIETEPIRFDEYTQKRMTFFRDPDDLPLELHE